MPVLNPMVTAPEPPPVKRYVLVFLNLAIQIDLHPGIMEEIEGKILILSYYLLQLAEYYLQSPRPHLVQCPHSDEGYYHSQHDHYRP